MVSIGTICGLLLPIRRLFGASLDCVGVGLLEVVNEWVGQDLERFANCFL